MEAKAKETVLALLRELECQFRSMDEVQISEFMNGAAKLDIRIVPKKQAAPASKRNRLTDDELRQIGESLKTTRTREQGFELLNEKKVTKDDVTRLARQLDVPVQKSDSAEQLRSRIIESTIGFRIRSAAIQGGANRVTN